MNNYKNFTANDEKKTCSKNADCEVTMQCLHGICKDPCTACENSASCSIKNQTVFCNPNPENNTHAKQKESKVISSKNITHNETREPQNNIMTSTYTEKHTTSTFDTTPSSNKMNQKSNVLFNTDSSSFINISPFDKRVTEKYNEPTVTTFPTTIITQSREKLSTPISNQNTSMINLEILPETFTKEPQTTKSKMKEDNLKLSSTSDFSVTNFESTTLSTDSTETTVINEDSVSNIKKETTKVGVSVTEKSPKTSDDHSTTKEPSDQKVNSVTIFESTTKSDNFKTRTTTELPKYFSSNDPFNHKDDIPITADTITMDNINQASTQPYTEHYTTVPNFLEVVSDSKKFSNDSSDDIISLNKIKTNETSSTTLTTHKTELIPETTTEVATVSSVKEDSLMKQDRKSDDEEDDFGKKTTKIFNVKYEDTTDDKLATFSTSSYDREYLNFENSEEQNSTKKPSTSTHHTDKMFDYDPEITTKDYLRESETNTIIEESTTEQNEEETTFENENNSTTGLESCVSTEDCIEGNECLQGVCVDPCTFLNSCDPKIPCNNSNNSCSCSEADVIYAKKCKKYKGNHLNDFLSIDHSDRCYFL